MGRLGSESHSFFFSCNSWKEEKGTKFLSDHVVSVGGPSFKRAAMLSAQMITVIEEVRSFPAGWMHQCVLWFVTWTPHSFLMKCKPCCNLSHFCLPEVSVFIAQGMLPSTKQVRFIIRTQTVLARTISWPKHKEVSLVYNYFSPLALKPPGGLQEDSSFLLKGSC